MPIAKEQSDVFLARVANATDVDWARLAAFIDGEGTIFIQRRGSTRATLSCSYRLEYESSFDSVARDNIWRECLFQSFGCSTRALLTNLLFVESV